MEATSKLRSSSFSSVLARLRGVDTWLGCSARQREDGPGRGMNNLRRWPESRLDGTTYRESASKAFLSHAIGGQESKEWWRLQACYDLDWRRCSEPLSRTPAPVTEKAETWRYAGAPAILPACGRFLTAARPAASCL